MRRTTMILIAIIVLMITSMLYLSQRRNVIISQNERSLSDIGMSPQKVNELLSTMSPSEAKKEIEEIDELVVKISHDLGFKERGAQNWIKNATSIEEVYTILDEKYNTLEKELTEKIEAAEKSLEEHDLQYDKSSNESLLETYLNEQYVLIKNGVRDTCYNETYDDILIVNKSNCLTPDYISPDQDEMLDALDKMVAAAEQDGVELKVISTHRTYQYQVDLFNGYVDTMGYEGASAVSAWPGVSEHQTGLTVDFSSPSGDCELDVCYATTEQGKWLMDNAQDYGFILRYPEGQSAVTGYSYEPWHYRYVGVNPAVEIHNEGITLEEYLGIDYPIYE